MNDHGCHNHLNWHRYRYRDWNRGRTSTWIRRRTYRRVIGHPFKNLIYGVAEIFEASPEEFRLNVVAGATHWPIHPPPEIKPIFAPHQPPPAERPVVALNPNPNCAPSKRPTQYHLLQMWQFLPLSPLFRPRAISCHQCRPWVSLEVSWPSQDNSHWFGDFLGRRQSSPVDSHPSATHD